jgi:hypothetical protein
MSDDPPPVVTMRALAPLRTPSKRRGGWMAPGPSQQYPVPFRSENQHE